MKYHDLVWFRRIRRKFVKKIQTNLYKFNAFPPKKLEDISDRKSRDLVSSGHLTTNYKTTLTRNYFQYILLRIILQWYKLRNGQNWFHIEMTWEVSLTCSLICKILLLWLLGHQSELHKIVVKLMGNAMRSSSYNFLRWKQPFFKEYSFFSFIFLSCTTQEREDRDKILIPLSWNHPTVNTENAKMPANGPSDEVSPLL